MTAELCIGVIDVPHLNDEITTGDLAEILEAKYDLFRGFYESHAEEIADHMAAALDGALSNVLAGLPVPENPYADAMDWIRIRFRNFLDTGEVETIGMIGVPTEAALKGVNRRLAAKRGPRRESFVDSGLLRASFLAWMEIDGKDYGQGNQNNIAQAADIKSIMDDLTK